MSAEYLLAIMDPDLSSNSTPTRPLHPDTHNQQHHSGPYFSRRSRQELRSVKELVKLMQQRLTSQRDTEYATIYVFQGQRDDLVKVGYTTQGDVTRRAEQIMNTCGVDVPKLYETPPFLGAFRAEKIVHRLLESRGYNRYNCCNTTTHIEWFQLPFLRVVGVVNMVHSWFNNSNPYDSGSGQLRDEWKNGLIKWRNTQETQQPLEWMDFFLMSETYMHGRELFNGRTSRSPVIHGSGGISHLSTSKEAHERWSASQKRKKDRLANLVQETPAPRGEQQSHRTSSTIMAPETDVTSAHTNHDYSGVIHDSFVTDDREAHREVTNPFVLRLLETLDGDVEDEDSLYSSSIAGRGRAAETYYDPGSFDTYHTQSTDNTQPEYHTGLDGEYHENIYPSIINNEANIEPLIHDQRLLAPPNMGSSGHTRRASCPESVPRRDEERERRRISLSGLRSRSIV